jgi:hypothetical protein
MSFRDANATKVVAEAEAVIAKVLADLAASDRVLTAAGLDPAKAKAVLQNVTGPQQLQEADAQVKADLAAAEQEAAEEMARRGHAPGAAAPSQAPKKARMMI